MDTAKTDTKNAKKKDNVNTASAWSTLFPEGKKEVPEIVREEVKKKG